MPRYVILTVNQLAAVCNKCKGIVFNDKELKIINDSTISKSIQKLQEWTLQEGKVQEWALQEWMRQVQVPATATTYPLKMQIFAATTTYLLTVYLVETYPHKT